MEKRPRGRPKKIKDSIEPRQFGRAALVLSAYNEARKRGEKHSSAVTSTVKFVKRCNPTVPISEAGVRRILAMFQRKGEGTVLWFERSAFSEEDKKKFDLIFKLTAAFAEKKGLTCQQFPLYDDETRPREKFIIRYSERPNYPRHNAKKPKE